MSGKGTKDMEVLALGIGNKEINGYQAFDGPGGFDS